MGTVQSSSCTSSASASVCSSPRNNHYSEQQIQPTLDETINRILKLVGRKPMKNNYGMQRAVQLLAKATNEEKEQMLQRGVLRRICLLINEHCNLDLPPPSSPIYDCIQQQQRHSVDISGIKNNLIDKKEQKETEETREGRKKFIVGNNKSGKMGNRRSSTQQAKGINTANKQAANKKRPGSAESLKVKGIGYGRGSTKSKWNLERTVEERNLQEEHLIWLLSALIAYLWGDRLLERICDWELALNYKGGERRRSAPSMFYGEMPLYLEDEILIEQILQSAVIPLLVFHLNNDSVLDVSQHIKLYQVIFELTAGVSFIPAILPHLVKQQEKTNGKSIAKELIPQFRDNMNNYPMLVRGITEVDITFMDFIRKVILRMSREYERQLPTEKRIKTSTAPRYLSKAKLNGQQNGVSFHLRRRSAIPNNLNIIKTTNIQRNSNSFANIEEIVKLNNNEHFNDSLPSSPLYQSNSSIGGEGNLIKSDRGGDFRLKSSRGSRPMTRQMDRDEIARLDKQSYILQYKELLRELQISTWKLLLNDAGKPVYGYAFKKELRSVNPFSPTHKDRTKRIAKEISSMHNSLPLNASNAIFVCMDETRCDMLKVLISGPDDTPYQNGLFEFDVFFPVNYPQQPPKCSFLTTGSGNVRFNPNLYNDGKICLSILGTWEGRPEEKWNPLCSLLQVLISIQGLIFVHQPYFNEPGYEKSQGTPKGDESSRRYNLQIENATLVYAIYEQWKNGPIYFRDIIKRHFWAKRESVLKQAENWLQTMVDEIRNNSNPLKKNGEEISNVGGLFGGVFNSTAIQRQTVRKLVEAFREMKNPLLEEC